MNKADGASTLSNTEPPSRPLGSTEITLCKGLAGGTGVKVIALLFSKHHETSAIENALRHLQSIHPILRSRVRYQSSTKTYSFVTSSVPFIKVEEFDAESTSDILKKDSPNKPIVQIVEHGLNEDLWSKIHGGNSIKDLDVIFARSYELENKMRILSLQILSAICDRTAGATLLKQFLERLASQDNGGASSEVESLNNEVSSAMEDLTPKRVARGVWSTGKTLLGLTFTAVGLTNLSFKDIKLMPRSSRIIRLQLDQIQTQKLLSGCKSRGIKLFGAIAAAAMIAAHSLNVSHNNKFGMVTIFDCRSDLNPPLTENDLGFYYSGVITSHAVKGSGSSEAFWDFALKTCEAFSKTKKTNKHFTDLAIQNFMAWKAIENPSITPSSAQRTSFLSVSEEPISLMNSQSELFKSVGLEDSLTAPSSHGIGPSIGVYDTIQDGQLKLTCVYPSPLHSREQIAEIVDKMNDILISESHRHYAKSTKLH